MYHGNNARNLGKGLSKNNKIIMKALIILTNYRVLKNRTDKINLE